jgi:hypothetical protein
VSTAASSGVRTFVVGLTTAGGPEDATLSKMANMGGLPRMGSPSYYAAVTQAELIQSVWAIADLARQRSCTFYVGELPPDGRATPPRVRAGDVGIPRDPTHNDGWDYTDATETAISIYGSQCAALQGGSTQTVTIDFPCLLF